MKKLIISILFLLTFCVITNAQKVHLTVFGGLSNYQGDLQAKRFTFQQSHAAFGFGGLYEFSDKLYLRANVTVGKVAADDKRGGYMSRNLNFTSPITDVHLGLEYDLINPYENSLTPFVFGGISVFHFNPSAIDTAGNRVYLQPLGTEGQGFFMGRKKYNLTSFALPFGAGVKLALTKNVRVRFEVGLRKTSTDYLDDLSTTYANEADLLLNNGQRAVDLAFRGDEDKSGLSYPAENSLRGNPKSKDWYYFTGVGVSFRIGSTRSNQTGCPVNLR